MGTLPVLGLPWDLAAFVLLPGNSQPGKQA